MVTKMMFFVFAFTLSIQADAFASEKAGKKEVLSEQAYQVYRDIRDNEFRISPSVKDAISNHLSEIQALVYNQPSHGDSSYICVSRDRDGLAPWVIAFRDGMNVTQILENKFREKSACDLEIQSARKVHDRALMCLSRDGDGLAPWIFAVLSGPDLIRVQNVQARDLSSCHDVLNRGKLSRSGKLAICTSRDNDGLAPYIPMEIDTNSGDTIRGSEPYRDINQCWAFLESK